MNMVKKLVCGVVSAAVALGAASAWATSLPSGYTKVEYIQGDGSTGYLVTDFSPDPSNDTIVAEAELTTYGNNVNPQCLFVSAAMNLAATEPKQGIVLRSEGLRFDFVENGTPCYKDEVKATVGKRIIYTVKGGRMTWTGGLFIEQSDPAPAAWSGPLQILGIRYNGSATFCSSIKLYSLKVFRDKHLIHDFVPVLDSQSNPTLYDVRGNSAVTRYGTITAGPAVWLEVEKIPVQQYISGLACEPHPEVVDIESGATLTEGTDYTLSWADNDCVGNGLVTFTGIGSFVGKSQTATFVIAPLLPDGYKAVEYVHSSGEQFVDTGFFPNEKTRADIKFLMHSSGEYSSPFGARNGNDDQFFVSGKYAADYYFSRHGTGATDLTGKDGYAGPGALVNKPAVIGYHKFSLNQNVFSLDEYSYSFSASATFTCPYSAYVFASHGTGGIQHPAAMELYSLKIWDDGVLVRDFIPCVKIEGNVETVGLYDVLPTASKRFYENGGSGVLVAGPEGNIYGDLLFQENILTIDGSPEQYGTASPAYGDLTGLEAGDTRAVSCSPTWRNSIGTVYSCTGWKLYDENDVVVSNGTETAFTYTHPTPAAYRRLEWQWELTSLPHGGVTAYVQDGLIACWDGIENAGAGQHDAAATVWKDAIGGYEFALNNTIVGDESMTFTGEKSGGYITSYGVLSGTDTVSTFVAAKTGTVEIVYRAISTSATQVFLQAPHTSGIAFGIYQTSSFLNFSYNSTNNKQGFAFTSGTDVNLVSMRYSDSGPVSAIGNGNTLSRQNNGYWGYPNGGTQTYVGARANRQADPFNGAIYCIRLYSRQLTDEEIAANQEVDRKRFILHVGPDILNVTTSAEGVGSPSPAYGFVRGLGDGQTVSVSCGNAVVTNSNGSVYSCTGWKIFDENSALVSSGSDTAFTYTHPTPAAYRELQWQWEMTSPPTEYVQDGLLAFWDGIQNIGSGVHVDGTNVWKDLVGGYEFSLTGTTIGDNSMIFDGTASSYGTLSATDTDSTFLAAKSGTLEIVYRSTSTTASQVLMQSTGASGLAYAIWETSKILPYTSGSQASQQSFSFSSGTSTNFVAVRYSSSAPISAIANGSALVSAGGSSWASPGTETFIGNRATKATGFTGSIYAIRLYDRQLTNPEILANQALDRSRFSQDDRESMLVVSGSQDGLGSPAPAYGYLVGLSAGDARIVSCGEGVCSNSAETAEYVCDGWKLFDDSGTVVDSGTGQSFTYTHPSPAAFRRLEWQWRATSVRGTVSAGAGGSVTVSGTAWYATDTPVNLAATPDSGKGFIQWTGTVPAGISGTSASFDFTPTAPFELTANFGPSFYVAKTGNDGNPGTEELPFATISNAIEKAAAEIDANGGSAAVHIASGTYEETGFVLDRPIVVIGDDRDTVNIYDAVQKSRAFTISHDNAAVMNLTISGTGYNYYNNTGGHVQMSAGTVENCIIRDGHINQSGSVRSGGGNVHISGGRLVRCQVLGGVLAANAWYQNASYGAGVYASGGIVDSCLIKGNQSYNNGRCGGIYVSGDATVVNCTVTGNLPPPSGSGDTVTAGIHIGSAEATVANCVFYGNGDGSAAANFGTANLNRFFNCASSADNPSCATWKVLTDDDFAEYAAGNLRPRAGSQLIDNGSKSRRPADGATLDLDGENRVSGESVDIGAWEYDQSQLSCGGHLSSYSALEQSNVVFYATAIGTASNPVFRWDYGNGTVEETQESAHVYAYPASGLFTVRLSASPDGGASWCEWYTVPTRMVVAPETMYVDSNCATPAFPYKTRDTAAATLGAAYGALTNNVSEGATCVDGAEIVILKGSRLTETDMHLESAVTIRGDTDDPSDVEIVDAVQKSRAFAIVHPQARVANLTISGTGYYWASSTGGHVQMSAGTVENCIIRDGRINQSSSARSGGGNVHISGGRLLRCQVLGGVLAANAWNQNVSYGAGVYASGGIVDSCLIKGNQSYNNGRCGGIYVSGDAKVVNCTVTGNLPSSNVSGDTVTAGIHIGSAEATVANCVFYGNGDGSAKANFGTGNLSRFFYCASSETNASCATWKVIDETAFNNWSRRDENVKYLSPKNGGALIDSGSTWSEYVETYGGTATVDLLGNDRKTGRSLDIGCIELKRSGSVYYLR